MSEVRESNNRNQWREAVLIDETVAERMREKLDAAAQRGEELTAEQLEVREGPSVGRGRTFFCVPPSEARSPGTAGAGGASGRFAH